MSRRAVTLEHGRDGGWIGWVHELPGCFVRGGSREEVEAALPEAIARFTRWAAEADDEAGVEVVEVVETGANALDDSTATLAPEAGPLDLERWRRLERWLERSRGELLELLAALPPDELDRRREGSSRTVREEVVHIGFTELM